MEVDVDALQERLAQLRTANNNRPLNDAEKKESASIVKILRQLSPPPSSGDLLRLVPLSSIPASASASDPQLRAQPRSHTGSPGQNSSGQSSTPNSVHEEEAQLPMGVVSQGERTFHEASRLAQPPQPTATLVKPSATNINRHQSEPHVLRASPVVERPPVPSSSSLNQSGAARNVVPPTSSPSPQPRVLPPLQSSGSSSSIFRQLPNSNIRVVNHDASPPVVPPVHATNMYMAGLQAMAMYPTGSNRPVKK